MEKPLKITLLLICVALIFIFSAARFGFGQNQPPILTLDEAVKLALAQASAFKSAQINERIAAEEIKISKSAFYPKIAAAPNVILTTPSFGRTVTAGVTDGNISAIQARPPSFLGANAITEYQGLVTATGEIDVSGRLKATLRRDQFLLKAARLGSETARLDLVKAVTDAYFNFALAATKRRGAEMNLEAALEFENNTKLQLDAGEVAPVDLIRARLQTAQRRDEIAQTRAEEIVSGDNLKLLVGYDFTEPTATVELLEQIPVAGEIANFSDAEIALRPELTQFDAQIRAAE
ncbi:MAG: TolC family protein, partial [Pyrinomonadaceae bacterium]